jgi:hypothetical protein
LTAFVRIASMASGVRSAGHSEVRLETHPVALCKDDADRLAGGELECLAERYVVWLTSDLGIYVFDERQDLVCDGLEYRDGEARRVPEMNHSGHGVLGGLEVLRDQEEHGVARHDIEVDVVHDEGAFTLIPVWKSTHGLYQVPQIPGRHTQDIRIHALRLLALVALDIQDNDGWHIAPQPLEAQRIVAWLIYAWWWRIRCAALLVPVRLPIGGEERVLARGVLVGGPVGGLAGGAAVLDEAAAGADEVGGVETWDAVLNVGAHRRAEIE